MHVGLYVTPCMTSASTILPCLHHRRSYTELHSCHGVGPSQACCTTQHMCVHCALSTQNNKYLVTTKCLTWVHTLISVGLTHHRAVIRTHSSARKVVGILQQFCILLFCQKISNFLCFLCNCIYRKAYVV